LAILIVFASVGEPARAQLSSDDRATPVKELDQRYHEHPVAIGQEREH